jgi:hypothetical protein
VIASALLLIGSAEGVFFL